MNFILNKLKENIMKQLLLLVIFLMLLTSSCTVMTHGYVGKNVDSIESTGKLDKEKMSSSYVITKNDGSVIVKEKSKKNAPLSKAKKTKTTYKSNEK